MVLEQRRLFFGANWKMHKIYQEAIHFFQILKQQKDIFQTKNEIVFFVPASLLCALKINPETQSFLIGAQNFFYEDKGAFTGEISAAMLAQEGISYAIVGHSERRILFQEDDQLLRKKVEKGLEKNLKIVFCVGENLEEREKNKHFEKVEKQLSSVLSNIVLKKSEDLIIAYEPVWAIGTGKNATPEQAEEMHYFIRNTLQKLHLPAEEIRIIYGGSVKKENIKAIMTGKNIDGALVGGASLNPEEFYPIACFQREK